jgi:hypothetical protein
MFVVVSNKGEPLRFMETRTQIAPAILEEATCLSLDFSYLAEVTS